MGVRGWGCFPSAGEAPDADPAGTHDREGTFETVAFPASEFKDSGRKLRPASGGIANEDYPARRAGRSEYQTAKITVFGQYYPALGARKLDYTLVGRAWRLLDYRDDIEASRAQPAHHREIAAFVGEKSRHSRGSGK